MSDTNLIYSLEIVGSDPAALTHISGGLAALNNTATHSAGVWKSFTGNISAFNQAAQYVGQLSGMLKGALAPGADLESSLAALSATSGITGGNLELVERHARQTATTFGGTAAQSVETYNMLLEQLSPQLARSPEALGAMGNSVATLGKTMGGDSAAATEVLTTAMREYGVSLDNPLEASDQMAVMMNVMAAASREGSARLPEIGAALEQCGAASRAAGLSFEETNAAIQVLDSAGRAGAEGGMALRGVMDVLSQSSFMPEGMQLELQAAGVDVRALTDNSLSLTERLSPLKAMIGDTTLFTKIFGEQNAAAGMALVQNIDEVNRCVDAITGTRAAYDQAATAMDTYEERQARVQAQFDDFRISLFNVTGDFGLWTVAILDTIVPLLQLAPLITLISGSTGTFGTVMAATFTGLKTIVGTACRGISVAIGSIPIIGWIAIAVTAIVALGIHFWNTSAKFRATLKGIGAVFVATFQGIWELAKNVFGAIGDLLKAAFRLDGKGIKEAIGKMKGGFSDFGANVGSAFDKAYQGEMERSKAEKAAKDAKENEDNPELATFGAQGGGAITTGLATANGATTPTGGRPTAVNVTIERLVEKFEIHTTNMYEDLGKVKDMVAQALYDAVNDLTYAVR